MHSSADTIAAEIAVPWPALPFVLHQRPMLQGCNAFARRLRIPFKTKIALDCRLRSRAIRAGYNGIIQQDYQSIREHLPETASSILDIGCGVAGIDVLLMRRYGPLTRLFLLDKTASVDQPRYGFGSREEFYNSLDVARLLLAANGVDLGQTRFLEASATTDLPFEGLDLVISLASWGFHYPVSTYLERVCSVLRPAGRVLLDIRAGTGEEGEVRERFNRVEHVCELWDGVAHRFCLREMKPAEGQS